MLMLATIKGNSDLIDYFIECGANAKIPPEVNVRVHGKLDFFNLFFYLCR